ncbi:MAG: hypothetical protein Hyperionvirus5_27 [Hyperionvirus sp.]|uniref:Uncharacterized protein n=1 Tax=Hyperionvirus sp. TaxID=2487770 RepID=A0A3G5AAH7_9VIRU|nr:MAG: hypothetical protein Hyperionvirus5_27 [Hyperionvirus sp.]
MAVNECQRLNIITIEDLIDWRELRRFVKQYEKIQNDKEPLTIIIRSEGGQSEPTNDILKILDNHSGIKLCYIHEYALSAGTVIAFHCDKIFMEKNSMLSPIDPWIRFSQFDVPHSVLEDFAPLELDSETYEYVMQLYHESQKDLQTIFSIKKLNTQQQNEFKQLFFDINVPHNTIYSPSELVHLGLNITIGLHSDIYDIINDRFIPRIDFVNMLKN